MRAVRLGAALVAFLAVSAVIQFSTASTVGHQGVVLVGSTPLEHHRDGADIGTSAFRVTFVNYDAGVPDATVTLELMDHEGGVLASDTVAIGGDAPGGMRDMDGQVGYDLRSLLPSHMSGRFMFRLTVEAMGSKGSDLKVLTFFGECGEDEDEGDDEGKGEDEAGGEDEGQDEAEVTEDVALAGAAAAVGDQPGFAG
jgi:hypothetical protein